MDGIEWKCNDCGYMWVADKLDALCPKCDENNIETTIDILQ